MAVAQVGSGTAARKAGILGYPGGITGSRADSEALVQKRSAPAVPVRETPEHPEHAAPVDGASARGDGQIRTEKTAGQPQSTNQRIPHLSSRSSKPRLYGSQRRNAALPSVRRTSQPKSQLPDS